MKRHIRIILWTLLLTAFAILFLINISTGSAEVGPGLIVGMLFGKNDVDPLIREIFINFRLTKALTCILAGSALSVGGLYMQTLFRNPLAGPDVFGLSSGASLFVGLLMMGGTHAASFFSGPFALALAASTGSALIFALVLLISFRVRDNTSLLLIGLMIGAATSSVVSVLQFVSRSQEQHYYLIWTFGSLSALDWTEIKILLAVILVGIILGTSATKSLNAWLLGDDYARSVGVRPRTSRLIIVIATCLLTGGVTAFCGPIAFVGLAVPHLARLVFRSTDHRELLPAVIVTGAGLLLLCDVLAQLPGNSQIIPINAVTALVGAPVVISIIIRSRKVGL